jgi:trafficking protein particle complex subunit 4
MYTFVYILLYILFSAGADDGIEEIRAAGMILQCLQTVTGIKFVMTAAVADHDSSSSSSTTMMISNTLREVLKEIYILYTECVLKDPFYELEMPIRSDLFVQAVDGLIQRYNNSNNMILMQKSTSHSTQSKSLY